MKNISLFIVILSVSCFAHAAIQEWQLQDKKDRMISYTICRPDEIDSQILQQLHTVFMKSFSEAYKNIPLAVLGAVNLENFLNEAFAQEESIIKKGDRPGYFLIIAHCNEKLTGFASFDTEEDHCYYIRELSMHPDFQRSGIGQQLIFSVKMLDDQVRGLRLVTRRANIQARNFYKKIGFIESSYIHEGFDPAKYVGYEKKF